MRSFFLVWTDSEQGIIILCKNSIHYRAPYGTVRVIVRFLCVCGSASPCVCVYRSTHVYSSYSTAESVRVLVQNPYCCTVMNRRGDCFYKGDLSGSLLSWLSQLSGATVYSL